MEAPPSAFYGLRVTGIATSVLERFRATAASAVFGPAGGKSRTLQFALSAAPKTDPVYAANSSPLKFWSRAIVEGWMSPVFMAGTFQRVRATFNNKVLGLCSAVLATLSRLGWTAQDWDRWTTGTGAEIDLHQVWPGTLGKLVDLGTERALMEGLVGSRGLENLLGPPMLEPIRHAQAQLFREGFKAGGSLLATHVAGGLWTQYRLYHARSVTTSICQVCQQSVGDTPHRLFCCDFFPAGSRLPWARCRHASW